ncbi:uncharacterized protein MONBRDRAFT_36476 [Monosiga brevicollis MX1]|uniref:Uncharacterized protein n=1 Tax=Monosiga brevicollis TaxID=81824 RepID=A9UVF8_MONBE|nr:uncharacterized protein MONBRDRAFT_36476 [Monosiga brevicollis MX1]EDQ90573.1 predicted protein [Monosiga brevicollis MX1]|eukprot:XP_001744624.1 hypothetical protein [Monosiga brevicollis MX1]
MSTIQGPAVGQRTPAPLIESRLVIREPAIKQPTAINLDFIRSGEQFARSRAMPNTTPETMDQLAPPTSRPRSDSQRLQSFYEKTLLAVAEATRRRTKSEADSYLPARPSPVTPMTPVSVVNLDFLRSGRQFLQPPLA